MSDDGIRQYRQDVGEVSLHVAEAGEGEPVLLLHGFPERWTAFRALMLGLARRGLRAIAPDLRGYGASDKPRGIKAYRSAALVSDLRELIERRCAGRAHVVAHDWGGTLAYCLAASHPELVSRLVILNAAHPERLAELFFTSRQFFRSWYIFAFQVPFVPELVLRRRKVIEALLNGARGSAARPVFAAEAVSCCHEALSAPHAARSAANYYRASFRWPVRAPEPVTAPTLVIWGARDRALDARLLSGLERFVPKLRVERVESAGHFIHQEAPELVERLVLEHLTRSGM